MPQTAAFKMELFVLIILHIRIQLFIVPITTITLIKFDISNRN